MIKYTICIAGAGAIGTAMGQVMSHCKTLDVTLLSVEPEVVSDINTLHINRAYFPQIRLNPLLKATMDETVLEKADIVFLAIPSGAIVPYVQKIKPLLNPRALVVNLAKGFAADKTTITASLQKEIQNPVCSMKGPTFARELMNNIPTAMTVGTADHKVHEMLRDVFTNTTIHTDFSDDISGVEVLSILKNIYAIIIGIVDAHFDSPNLRFLVFTKAFNEMRRLLLLLGGRQETMFLYCGIGDFGLTALNDLSRNRTLGLLIGKGFFSEEISGKVVLEGRIAVDIIVQRLKDLQQDPQNYMLLNELHKIFNGSYEVKKFVSNVLSKDSA